MEARADDVITVINYTLDKAEKKEAEKPQSKPRKSSKNDGFWNF